MKKFFSLLLVGVVIIVIFDFVAPNRVDATETSNKNSKMVCISYFPDAKNQLYKVYCNIDCYGKNGNKLGFKYQEFGGHRLM